MYRAGNKKEQFVKDIAEAVAEVIRSPKYSALSIGGETKQTVIEHITAQLDAKIAEGKEKNVDRILATVKDKLMKAPQFEFNHEPETGTVLITYAEPQKDYALCNNCDGKGTLERKYYTTFEKYDCPECKGAGRKEFGF